VFDLATATEATIASTAATKPKYSETIYDDMNNDGISDIGDDFVSREISYYDARRYCQ
jgi:hypothetical protein